MKPLLASLFFFYMIHVNAQLLSGFSNTGVFNEQELSISNYPDSVLIEINAPLHFSTRGKTYLIFYALPNGNSIEWTKGKFLAHGDDWHYDIQHIAAQTRFIRNLDKNNNYIVAYIANKQKSWPLWKRSTTDAINKIRHIVDSVTAMFQQYKPQTILNGHSGGGGFIFGYIDAVKSIPSEISRIAFLDSDYGYETEKHQKKLSEWLQQNKKSHLTVLAYNDSVALYNGKPLVSATGGTWYRSRLMQRDLASSFSFTTTSDTAFIHHYALNGRIAIHLKENPTGLIYHTVQVEKNGFIYSILGNSRYDRKKYFTYFGERVYSKYITGR